MEQLLKLTNYPLLTVGESPITAGTVLMAVIIIVGGYLVARWLQRFMVARLTARQVSADLIHLCERIYLIVILAVLVITLLDLLNVPLTAFAFITGAIAIGVGFGAQNIINNFISGWILLWERPIKIGDFVEIGDTKGTVESINTRSTRIRRVDGVHLLVPNSQLLENTVVNWTLVDRLARTQLRVGVAYGSPVEQVAEILQQIADAHPDVLKEPEPLVIFDDFGDSSLNFDLYFWVMAVGDRDLRFIRSQMRFSIDQLFRENDITISFPQRDVHLDNLSPIEVRVVNEGVSSDE